MPNKDARLSAELTPLATRLRGVPGASSGTGTADQAWEQAKGALAVGTGESTLTLTARGLAIPPGRVPVLVRLLNCDHPLDESSGHPLDVDEVLVCRGPRREARRTVEGRSRRLVLSIPDAHMSANHARLLRAPEGYLLEDAGSKNGTKVNGITCDRALLRDGDLLEFGCTFFLYRNDAWAIGTPDTQGCLGASCGLATLIPSLLEQLRECERVARSQLPVLILGESGTGKELVARAVHEVSERRGAFVAINCGALPESLVEAELFGTRKGAFSGAVEDRPGLFRTSHEGTLFLDEIAELPLEAQAALLRVLQESEVLAVGATRPVRVDLRVVAATHGDLQQRVAAGTFRADLFARLAGFTVRLPPLRERREDLGILLAQLLGRALGGRKPPALSNDAARAIITYDWPFNVRELEKCLGAAVVLSDGCILLEHLPDTLRQGGGQGGDLGKVTPRASASGLPPRPEHVTPQLLVALLTKHRGSISAVARELGRQRMQIRRWIKQYQIEVARFQV
jgi:transcriptional regulator with AAA-type ATPase domain/pSer/pThr/pTyr-binding forkhead associated (FHA) protein